MVTGYLGVQESERHSLEIQIHTEETVIREGTSLTQSHLDLTSPATKESALNRTATY